MANNINGLTSVQSGTNRPRESPQVTSDSSAQAEKPARLDSDQVKLSPEAKQLQDVETGIRNFPIVNHERADTIREALRDGNYKVDPARLAAKIVQFELDI